MFSIPEEESKRKNDSQIIPSSSILFSSTPENNAPPSSQFVNTMKDLTQAFDSLNSSSSSGLIENELDPQKPIFSDPQDSNAVIPPSSTIFQSNPEPSSSGSVSQFLSKNPFLKANEPSPTFNFDTSASGPSQSNYLSPFDQTSKNMTPFGTAPSSVQQGFITTPNLFKPTEPSSNTGLFNLGPSSGTSNLFSSPSSQQGSLFNNSIANNSGFGVGIQSSGESAFGASTSNSNPVPSSSQSVFGSSQTNLSTPVFGGSFPNSPQLNLACTSGLCESGPPTSQPGLGFNQGNPSSGLVPSQGGGFGGSSNNSLFAPSSDPRNLNTNNLFGSPQPVTNSVQSSHFGAIANASNNSGFGFSSTQPAPAFSQPQTGSLFGSSSNAPSNSGFGFSNTQPAPAFSQPQTGSLFGSSSNAPNNSGFGFSNTQPAPAFSQPQTGSLFGSSSNASNNSGFGGNQNQGLFSNSGGSASGTGFGGNQNQGLFNNSGGSTSGTGFGPSCGNSTNGVFNGNTTSNGLFGSTFNNNGSTSSPLFGSSTISNQQNFIRSNPFGSSGHYPQSFCTCCGPFNPHAHYPQGLFHPNPPSLFNQPFSNNSVPPFEEIPEPGNVYAAHITLVNKGEEPEIELCINGSDTYYLSMKVLLKYSIFFQEKISVSKKPVKIYIDFPFPSAFYNVLLWIFYRNTELLLRQISTLNQLLEVLAVANLLNLSGELRLKNILISHCTSKNLLNTPAMKFSAVFHRRFFDISFFLDLFKPLINLFGQPSNFVKAAMILEWLGERECKSEEEVMELMNSLEFKQAGEFIASNRILPNNLQDLAILARRYPIGIQTLNIHKLLNGFGLPN